MQRRRSHHEGRVGRAPEAPKLAKQTRWGSRHQSTIARVVSCAFVPLRDSRTCCSGSFSLSLQLAFWLLVAARLTSAALNFVHDCDEVYNYWEPLHYIMYGSGMQTWEYSAQYALRCWLYLLLHAAVMAPVAAVVGAGRGGPRCPARIACRKRRWGGVQAHRRTAPQARLSCSTPSRACWALRLRPPSGLCTGRAL